MGANLLTKKPIACGNCRNHLAGDGECPVCGTYWWGGAGFRIEWEPGGAEKFIRDAAKLAKEAGLPPGAIQVLTLNPRNFFAE
jgi:hypothetical protein